ncbi:TenA family transcriptional regulator [Dyella tabacisoli]|uniref:Iron-containing redox enzyme family protein n=1 Tax=Dyella tabacisoli TaxID=2282381 RepID=A0A369USI3_9GAMM|nr:iron-containing redox enzyme family protein [Dyella tabacisoli]RDD83714.1 iron-containing redox enzyme family protein [Dyella tabacisoli]
MLNAMSRGEVDISDLRILLIQHYHYSRHFTRYLCALISRMSSMDDIHCLMENLLEEMGLDGDDKVTHAELFQRSLRTVGADPASQPPLAETQDVVRTMIGYCRSPDPINGLAALCLGAEAIVPLIYRPIQSALVAHDFGSDATEFFKLHIEEDENHALTMLSILTRMTRHDRDARARAKAVGIDIINKRSGMLDAVWSGIQNLSLAAPGLTLPLPDSHAAPNLRHALEQ